jgi:hypothetical protein
LRRKKEEGRRKKEEGRRKKEEGRRKKEEGRRKKEEGDGSAVSLQYYFFYLVFEGVTTRLYRYNTNLWAASNNILIAWITLVNLAKTHLPTPVKSF